MASCRNRKCSHFVIHSIVITTCVRYSAFVNNLHIITTAAIEMEAAMEHLAAFIPQQLLQGHTVKVPGLGSFRISFKSKGTESVADFNASAMISEPRIMFTPDKALRNSVIPNLVFENGGLLKDGVRYATMADYLKATGSGSAGTGGEGDSGNNSGATGGNPL